MSAIQEPMILRPLPHMDSRESYDRFVSLFNRASTTADQQELLAAVPLADLRQKGTTITSGEWQVVEKGLVLYAEEAGSKDVYAGVYRSSSDPSVSLSSCVSRVAAAARAETQRR